MDTIPNQFSIGDIERLAKAGVAVDFASIAGAVTRDQFFGMPPNPQWPRSLEDSFWDRWRRANPAPNEYYEVKQPWVIHAYEHGGTVYVWVCPHGAVPFTLEDEATLFPSDTLMAKLVLYEKSKPV